MHRRRRASLIGRASGRGGAAHSGGRSRRASRDPLLVVEALLLLLLELLLDLVDLLREQMVVLFLQEKRLRDERESTGNEESTLSLSHTLSQVSITNPIISRLEHVLLHFPRVLNEILYPLIVHRSRVGRREDGLHELAHLRRMTRKPVRIYQRPKIILLFLQTHEMVPQIVRDIVVPLLREIRLFRRRPVSVLRSSSTRNGHSDPHGSSGARSSSSATGSEAVRVTEVPAEWDI